MLFLAPVSSEFPNEEREVIIMAPQACSDKLGRQAPAHSGGRGRSSPVVALKSGNKEVVALESDSKEVVALKSGLKEEDLGHQVIQRFPQEKRRNTFEVEEEQKGKWRRKKSEEGADSFEMEEVGKMDKKQMMDDVALLMKKVAEALAEFAMDQSVHNLGRMGLEE